MTQILATDNYVLHAVVVPVKHPPGHYCFTLLSQLLTARDPDERRVITSFICDRAALQALAHTIHAAL